MRKARKPRVIEKPYDRPKKCPFDPTGGYDKCRFKNLMTKSVSSTYSIDSGVLLSDTESEKTVISKKSSQSSMIRKVNSIEIANESRIVEKSSIENIDPITRKIFQNEKFKIEECLKLCESSKYYIQLEKSDKEKLFNSAIYEIIVIYTYFHERSTIESMSSSSSNSIKSLIELLNGVDIKSIYEVQLIMMLSILSYDRLKITNDLMDLDLIKILRGKVSDQLMAELQTEKGLDRFINVILVIPQLREFNDYWKRSNFS